MASPELLNDVEFIGPQEEQPKLESNILVDLGEPNEAIQIVQSNIPLTVREEKPEEPVVQDAPELNLDMKSVSSLVNPKEDQHKQVQEIQK